MAMVMPGTLRKASPRVVVAWLFMVAVSMTLTAWGVSWTLPLGMDASGGAWLSPFLSALSLTVTGPSWTGAPLSWAEAEETSSRAAPVPDNMIFLRDVDTGKALSRSA